jgi:patched 1 protein
MAFSKSTIIRTFFRLIFGTIIFALMVGLILMPVLFSWLNLPPIKSVLTGDAQPPPSEEEEDRKQQQQQKPEDIKQDMEAGK